MSDLYFKILFFSVCVLSVRMSGVIIKQLLTYLLTSMEINLSWKKINST